MDELGKRPEAYLAYELSEEPDGSPVVKLKGELDMTTTPRLEATVGAVIARSPSRLVVDARELEFADSSAIALLVSWANRVDELEVRQPSELLRRVIVRMGLADKLRVSP
jgi:anti-anti-sigma factor